MGVIAAGTMDSTQICFGLVNLLINNILLGSTRMVSLDEDLSSDINTTKKLPVFSREEIFAAIRCHTQKLLSALSTAFGLIAWAVGPLLLSDPISRWSQDSDGYCHNNVEFRINALQNITIVLCELIRNAGEKVKLQACKGLISMAYFQIPDSKITANEVFFREELFGEGIRFGLFPLVIISSSVYAKRLLNNFHFLFDVN